MFPLTCVIMQNNIFLPAKESYFSFLKNLARNHFVGKKNPVMYVSKNATRR